MPESSAEKTYSHAPSQAGGVGIVDLIPFDRETLLIFLVLIILLSEKADMKLILALLYILL